MQPSVPKTQHKGVIATLPQNGLRIRVAKAPFSCAQAVLAAFCTVLPTEQGRFRCPENAPYGETPAKKAAAHENEALATRILGGKVAIPMLWWAFVVVFFSCFSLVFWRFLAFFGVFFGVFGRGRK